MRLARRFVPLLCALAACARPGAATDRAPGVRDSTAAAVHLATPPSLAPVFQALDTLLSFDQRAELRRALPESSMRYHFPLGMWIRNRFGLWRGGPLHDSLAALGVEHPDAMSDVVLQAYGLHLRDQPIDLRALARKVRAAPAAAPAQ